MRRALIPTEERLDAEHHAEQLVGVSTANEAGGLPGLHRLKRKVLLSILAVNVTAGWLEIFLSPHLNGAVRAGGGWLAIFLSPQLNLAAFFSMVSITLPVLALAWWPATLRLVEYTMALLIAALFIWMLLTGVYLQPDVNTLISFAILAPSVYILAFLLLGVRGGIQLSLGFLSCAVLITTALFALGGTLSVNTTTFATLGSFVVVSIVSIACLYAFAFFLERHVQVRSQVAAVARFAYVDTLTGLPNRRLFGERLERALARGEQGQERFALLFVDLDRFKHVNDTYGHHTGDELLRQVARRLQGAVGAHDTAARISGDEFAVIVHGVWSEADAGAAAQNVLLALSAPLEVAGQSLRVSCSIGVSVYPQHGSSAEQLLTRADQAMYEAKAGGRHGYRLVEAPGPGGAPDRYTIERELHLALARGQLQLHYQPIYDAASGALSGVEALARWPHPQLGDIPPSAFIPVAEQSRLILPLGHWVLREACLQNKAWQRAGHPPVAVAVNVSAVQFERPEFVDDVKRALAESGLAPQWLQLELTESAVFSDASLPRLAQLRALGVGIWLDDFGTGFSSLSQVQRLPITGFKIDRSFVRNLADRDSAAGSRRMIRVIMLLAEALDLSVVAEGVESGEQLDEVKRSGCPHAQGFWLSRPLPPDEAERLLAGVLPVKVS